MKHRLNLDIKDPNYILLKKIFKIIDSRKSLQILASYEFKNLNKQIFAFKIIFISMFFGLDISFILNKLEIQPKNLLFCKNCTSCQEDFGSFRRETGGNLEIPFTVMSAAIGYF